MIDWDSPSWGNRVHQADNGSWVVTPPDEETQTGRE